MLHAVLALVLLSFNPWPALAQQVAVIQLGMTEAEVRTAFGPPQRVEVIENASYLYYPDCEPERCGVDIVALADGRVIYARLASPYRRIESPRADDVAPQDTLEVAALRSYRVTPVLGPGPVIDGRLDEGVWSRAESASGFIQVTPVSGAPATERTEAWIVYDEHAIYVGFRLHDSRPDSIVARLGRRDADIYSDWVQVQIDSNLDGRTAYGFSVNPRGVKADGLLYEDTERDEEWDAVWDAAARTDSAGWTAEFRIPFSQLRFTLNEEGGTSVWGLNLTRYLARRDETSHWSPIPRSANRFVSLFGEMNGFDRIPRPRGVEILPYSVARLSRLPGDAKNPFFRRNDFVGSLGADVKVRVTSNFTLAATINPDFGQVEADPAEVNLTAYETNFPEKRPFFIEGRDIFRFEEGNTELFYTRRIGRPPQREVKAGDGFVESPSSTTILGATKLSGRSAGGWSVGALHAVTAEENARIVAPGGQESTSTVEPLTSYGVLRFGKDFGRGNGEVGGVFTATNRWVEDGSDLDFLRSAAYAGGLNGRLRFGNYSVTGALLGSHIEGETNAIRRAQRAPGRYFQRSDAGHLKYDAARRVLDGFSGGLSFGKVSGAWLWRARTRAVSPGFEVNDLGFQRGADAISQSFFIGRYGYGPGRVLRSWGTTLNTAASWTFGGERQLTTLGLDGNFQFLNLMGGSVGVNRSFPALSPDALRGGPAIVTPGRTSGSWRFYGDTRRVLSLFVYGGGSLEDRTGGYGYSGGAAVTIRPSSRMEVATGPYFSRTVNAWQYVGEQVSGGETVYLFARTDYPSAALTLRLDYTFSPDLSLQFYGAPFVGAAQYSEFRRISDHRAVRFADRFHTFEEGQIRFQPESNTFLVDLSGDGTPELSIRNPSFNTKALDSNLVLRWEYRPGSTLFAVWSHGRWGYLSDGSFQLGRDIRQLVAASSNSPLPRSNVFLLKFSYWFGL